MSEPAVWGPDFIGIGAQKAGTTSVSAFLRDHPEVWIPPAKEIHYFHDGWQAGHRSPSPAVKRRKLPRIVRRMVRDRRSGTPRPVLDDARWLGRYALGRPSEAWYRRLFPPQQGKKRGEITPRYSTLGAAEVTRVKAMFPDLRVFLILRDPIERAWSQARFRGIEMTDAETIAFIDAPSQHARNSYDHALRTWSEIFSPHQFSVLFFEDLRADPRGFMTDLCRFLGVDPAGLDPDLLGERVNVSRQQLMPSAVRAHLERKYDPLRQHLADRFPRLTDLWHLA